MLQIITKLHTTGNLVSKDKVIAKISISDLVVRHDMCANRGFKKRHYAIC